MIALVGLAVLVAMGCSPTTAARAKNAADSAAYNLALDRCFEQGKATNSMEVYETCALEADRLYGRVTP